MRLMREETPCLEGKSGETALSMDVREIAVGQRWMSDAEPELGLGRITELGGGRVTIEFPASDERRIFALGNAPLRRVRFVSGDMIEHSDQRRLKVDAVENSEKGLLSYVCRGERICETELAANIRFSRPEDRLLAGIADSNFTWELRAEALRWRARLAASPARGLKGGRIDLLPHQMATAGEVADRPLPRVLLADEVGLGKTIEASLIAHRLLWTGRIARILVIVPESLVHQWFVELYRRFNLLFTIIDASAWEASAAGENPFLDAQWVIISEDFLVSQDKVVGKALAANWDLLIVDEAHHLEWRPEEASMAYKVVEKLAAAIPRLLLLTATPEQLGQAGHFARLRLLDPQRFGDLTAFRAEAAGYKEVADLVEKLETRNGPNITRTAFSKEAGHLAAAKRILDRWPTRKGGSRQLAEVIDDLIDLGGPGRVWFRTTRAQLTGFPERRAVLHPLSTKDPDAAWTERVRWLADLLSDLEGEKVLLITHSMEDVERLAEDLVKIINVQQAVFHQGLNLTQRDRNAAYFAGKEGARLLICSEIGSEGRNFQFAHHLVLFDLPAEPELLEQRIGRLDRIGQKEAIAIHIPYQQASSEEVLLRWYHEGLDAIEHSLPTGHGFAQSFRLQLKQLMQAPYDAKAVDALVGQTREAMEKFRVQLEDGRDRLLGLRAESKARGEHLIEVIRKEEKSEAFRAFALDLLDHLGVTVDRHSADRVRLTPGPMQKEVMPGLPEDGLMATFIRKEALAREDMVFISSDHPFVDTALERLLGSEEGNAGFAIWEEAGFDGLLLEAHYTFGTVAPRNLQVERFLDPTPLRVVVDHYGKAFEADYSLEDLKDGDIRPLVERGPTRNKLIPRMLSEGEKVAEGEVEQRRKAALETMEQSFAHEIDRMRILQQVNGLIRIEEIERLENQRNSLREVLTRVHPTLDAVRVIWCRS